MKTQNSSVKPGNFPVGGRRIMMLTRNQSSLTGISRNMSDSGDNLELEGKPSASFAIAKKSW